MVGLSVVLENQKSFNTDMISQKTPQVICKASMLINSSATKRSSSSSSSTSSSYVLFSPRRNSELKHPVSVPAFLEQCFLCNQKLLPGKDIYMYKGDRAFCSVECRCRQIFMDEEDCLKTENCSLAAIKPSTSSSSSSSASATSSGTRQRRTTRNRAY